MADFPELTSRFQSTGHGNEFTMTGKTGTSLEDLVTSFVTDAQTELEGNSTHGNGIHQLLERYEGLKDGLEAKRQGKVGVEADQKDANLAVEALDKGKVLQIVNAYRGRGHSVYVDDQRKALLDLHLSEYRNDETKERFPFLDPIQLQRARDACFTAFPRPGGAFISRKVYLDLAKWIDRNENRPQNEQDTRMHGLEC